METIKEFLARQVKDGLLITEERLEKERAIDNYYNELSDVIEKYPPGFRSKSGTLAAKLVIAAARVVAAYASMKSLALVHTADLIDLRNAIAELDNT